LTIDDLNDGNFEGCGDCRKSGLPEVVPPGAFLYATPVGRENVEKVVDILDTGIATDGEGTKYYICVLKDGRWLLVVSGHDYSGHG